jgi:(5-formylfuran-3-yl)methyl phosphate synthase
MTGMLASVNSIAEAKIVLDAGVDIIDIKNPHEGALGALKVKEVNDIVNFVSKTTLTSATIGDIKADDLNLSDYIISMAETGVDYVKVGLFENQPSDYFVKTIQDAANKGIKLVIVVFAENYQGVSSIVPLMQTGIVGIMLDTKEKKSKNLCAVLNKNELKQFVETAKEYELLTGLAGSLSFGDILSLLELDSDYLGFRGALCSESDRVRSINIEQVEKIRSAIPLLNFNKFQDSQYVEAIIG